MLQLLKIYKRHNYKKFIPDYASLGHPLNQLLHSGIKWNLIKECDQSFVLAKKLINIGLRTITHSTHIYLLWAEHSNFTFSLVVLKGSLLFPTHQKH